jgi:hypothetical protein
MRLRFIPCVALLCLLPAPARSAEETPLKPAVILRVNSLENLTADARYLAKLADKEELFKQFESILKSKTGEKGIEGLDPKKPIGFYSTVGPNGIDSKAVLMIPVADEKALLGMLENLDIKAEAGKEGLYTINLDTSPLPIQFRFANGYAYVTIGEEETIAKANLLAPAAVLPAGQVGTLSATVFVDRIPNKIKELVLGQTELRLAALKEKEEPGETKTQRAFREAVLDEAGARFKAVLKEGGEVQLRFDLDRKSGDVDLSVSFAGKPDSALAAEIAALGKIKSVGSGLRGGDPALSVAVAAALPEKLRKALEPVIDESMTAFNDKLNAAEREVLEHLFKAVTPTLKAAELDTGVSLRGPSKNGLYTLIVGAKVKDGQNIEKELKEFIKTMPPNDQKLFAIDFAKVGEVNVHRMAFKKSVKLDATLQPVFGENPTFFAVRGNAFLVAFGENGLDALKEAVAADKKPGRILLIETSLSRLAPAFGLGNKAVPAAAKKAFTEKDTDQVRITLEGGPALQLKIATKAQLVTFFSELDKAQKGGK